MDHTDNSNDTDISMHEHDDEHLLMQHVIQDDPELMYLHVCLSELLCKQGGQEELV